MGLHQNCKLSCINWHNAVKRRCTKGEKICANHAPDKGLIFRIYKELLQLNKGLIPTIYKELLQLNKGLIPTIYKELLQLNKGLISTIYKELLQLNNKNSNNLIKKWADLRNFYKDDMQMTNKHMKDAQYNLSIEKCKSKPQWDITSCPLEWLLSKNNKCWQRRAITSKHCWWECKMV